jgi:hypothetical protein
VNDANLAVQDRKSEYERIGVLILHRAPRSMPDTQLLYPPGHRGSSDRRPRHAYSWTYSLFVFFLAKNEFHTERGGL